MSKAEAPGLGKFFELEEGGVWFPVGGDHAVQAAVMSKAVGKPVKYFFTRKEEVQHDLFRPPTHHKLSGKLNAEGLLEHLEHHLLHWSFCTVQLKLISM